MNGSVFTTRGAPNVAAEPADYVTQSWDSDAGLAHDSVLGIAQTPEGYLWIATQGGLSRFDGVRFTSFLKGSTPGLESSYARAVFVDRSGALWIGRGRCGSAWNAEAWRA